METLKYTLEDCVDQTQDIGKFGRPRGDRIVREALTLLPEKAHVVEQCFLVGLNLRQIGTALGASLVLVKGIWRQSGKIGETTAASRHRCRRQ